MKTRVLYLEDEVFLAKIVKESLESRDYEVFYVEDGAAVLDRCRQFNPDICVLDVMVPSKDGFEVGVEIREEYPNLPIIYLTAKSEVRDILNGFSAGGNDYLKKPFSMEELIVRIENLLKLSAGGRVQTPSVYRLGLFEYHPNKMELHSDNGTTKLSHRENELLRILASQPNLPIQRKHILIELWGDDSFFNSRNLDVYVTRLRKYLAADSSVRINTLKGVGYQFVVE